MSDAPYGELRHHKHQYCTRILQVSCRSQASCHSEEEHEHNQSGRLAPLSMRDSSMTTGGSGSCALFFSSSSAGRIHKLTRQRWAGGAAWSHSWLGQSCTQSRHLTQGHTHDLPATHQLSRSCTWWVCSDQCQSSSPTRLSQALAPGSGALLGRLGGARGVLGLIQHSRQQEVVESAQLRQWRGGRQRDRQLSGVRGGTSAHVPSGAHQSRRQAHRPAFKRMLHATSSPSVASAGPVPPTSCSCLQACSAAAAMAGLRPPWCTPSAQATGELLGRNTRVRKVCSPICSASGCSEGGEGGQAEPSRAGKGWRAALGSNAAGWYGSACKRQQPSRELHALLGC